MPERLVYPVYSVKLAGYADTPEGAFELQRELGEDIANIDAATFVIGEPIDANEVDGLSADMPGQAKAGVTTHDIKVVELPEEDLFVDGNKVRDGAGEVIGHVKAAMP